MPTSLLYNWELEARKFTPDLRIMVYTGTYRDKNTAQFDDYDLILTSYGIVRIDIDLLSDYRFNYVILDESQAIKNPSSHITKAVMQLNTAPPAYSDRHATGKQHHGSLVADVVHQSGPAGESVLFSQ